MRFARRHLTLVLTLAACAASLRPTAAEACGCFTPPDPTVPVVQAGERILFAVHEGQVTAHVQIQYSGDAQDFGWLLPLPSVPTLELGTDEVFTQLYATTQPRYRMAVRYDPGCAAASVGITGGTGGSGGTGGGAGGFADAGSSESPLVVQDSIGPYDYAVLKADSRDAMLAWLADNRYFVPAGTEDGVAPYIHPGAFFLALKLKSGGSVGDLQPVVLHYASDVGMIPITLTSTGAAENMGVQVWMLGDGRAIPRNYNHTVINDAAIDWTTAGANYNDVIIRAAGEAPQRHTFVTEYAGTSAVMRNLLAPSWRFGTQEALAGQPTASAFIASLWSNGFGAPRFSGQLKAILTKYFPPPAGVSADAFFQSFDFYQGKTTVDYQPAALAAEIWSRVVEPTRAASALFDASPVLTRLYTTLSPQDMNRDPVFSFNAGLPEVSHEHQGTMQVHCGLFSGRESSATLVTEQGTHIEFPAGRFGVPAIAPSEVPASLRIEILSEEGPPTVVLDNAKRQEPSSSQGCTQTPGSATVMLGALALWACRRRPRSS